jgi:2-deoxy-D-gluconate 3-dehydrogenase
MQIPSLRVKGKVALVTGAGSGLGQASAFALAQSGADVAVTELPGKEAQARQTVEMVESAGQKALAVPLDVTNLPMIGDTVDQVVRHFGRIDILVNNAGINVPRLALEVTEDDWDRVLNVNLKGVFFVAQAVAQRSMVPRGVGKIINIASQNGVIGYFYRAAYCASKAGVVNLTRVLALEWAKYGINVNAIGPTFIETPLTKPMFENAEFKADVLSRIPLGRIGKPEDIVGAVVYLASPASDLVTGHTLLVDGGWTRVRSGSET